jgi:hypothetical protein
MRSPAASTSYRRVNQEPQCVLRSTFRRPRILWRRCALRPPNTYGVREWKDNTRARKIDLMERTEERTEERESMNSGTIINSNFSSDKPQWNLGIAYTNTKNEIVAESLVYVLCLRTFIQSEDIILRLFNFPFIKTCIINIISVCGKRSCFHGH